MSASVIPTAYLMLFVCIVTETLEQVFFKLSEQSPHRQFLYTSAGVLFYGLHMLAWFWVLTILPLGVALPLMGASYITVALASQLLFGEKIQRQRWMGIFLIIVGLCCVWKVVE